MKTHRLKENVRVRSLLVEKAGTAPRNNVSSKNIEVSVYGALSKIYEFYPAVLEEIPQAAQVRIDPQLGMVYKIPAVKQTEFEELARQHELALTGVGEVMA